VNVLTGEGLKEEPVSELDQLLAELDQLQAAKEVTP
jgi:hypothetical protein